MPARFIVWLIDWRLPLLAIGLAIMAAAYPFSTRVQFDRSIENMFAPDDPLLVPFHKLKDTFGGNEIVLAVYEDAELLDKSGTGIRRLAKVSKELQKAPGVQKQGVLSLAEVNQTLETLENIPFFSTANKTPAILDEQSELAARYRELFAGYTHSLDGTTVAIAVMLEPQDRTSAPRRDTIDSLRATMENLPDGLAPGMLAGEPVMLTDGFRYLEADGARLGRWSMLLLALVILLCFRSLRWVLIPIIIVQWSLVVTRAILAIAGLKLSMVSSMLTAIVTVVGVATVMHVIVHFRDELRRQGTGDRGQGSGKKDAAKKNPLPWGEGGRGTRPGEGLATSGFAKSNAKDVDPHPSPLPKGERTRRMLALRSAGMLLLMPIVWSCLTDAVGFGSLLAAKVGPVQDFGLMTAIGAVLVLPALGLLLPGLALLGNVDTEPASAWGEAWVDRMLTRWIDWVEHHPRLLVSLLLVLTALAIGGGLLVDVETDFTKNFRRDSPVVQSYEFIETRLGGAGVWDVIVPAPKLVDEPYLARVRALEDELRALTLPDPATGEPRAALTKVISFADADEAAKASTALSLLSPLNRSRGMQTVMPTFAAALRNTTPDADGRYYLRIMLRARERQGAAEKKWLIAEVERLSQAAFPATADSPGAEVTGFFVLLTSLIDSLLADQWITFGVSTLGIGLMMILALRSVKLSLIAIIPNALPIAVAISSLGWINATGLVELKMNMGSAMIAAVSMGLSIDSSVHYLLAYQSARKTGASVIDALHAAQRGCGLAMVFSTLALLVGFTVLATSEFIPTVYFGLLVSLAMFGGLLGNLIVLPLLVRMAEQPRK